MCCINSFRICTLVTYSDVCIKSFQICTQTTYLYVKGSDVCLQIITPSVQNTLLFFCQNFASSVTCHHSECIAVQLSRNPLGLEDLPQEIHWGWKIYIELNASNTILWREKKKRKKKAVFCSRLTVAGLESLWSISCLVAYRNCD